MKVRIQSSSNCNFESKFSDDVTLFIAAAAERWKMTSNRKGKGWSEEKYEKKNIMFNTVAPIDIKDQRSGSSDCS